MPKVRATVAPSEPAGPSSITAPEKLVPGIARMLKPLLAALPKAERDRMQAPASAGVRQILAALA